MTLDERLQEARKSAVSHGNKRAAYETAKAYVERIDATLYEFAPEEYKTVADRDAWVKRHPKHKDAIVEQYNRIAAWQTAKTLMELLFIDVEKYRSDLAHGKKIDRMHE